MKKKNLIIGGLVVLTLYALAGFFAAPAIVKPRLVESLEGFTHRSVQLRDLRINPFTFSATLEDFRLLDRDSTLLVSFRELYARYRITSLFRHVWALAQRRAAAVMAYVCQRGGINPARVFQLEVETGAKEEGRIRATLNLTVR